MKSIEIDEALYQYIVSKTQYIGESATSILSRLLAFPSPSTSNLVPNNNADPEETSTSVGDKTSAVQETVINTNEVISTNGIAKTKLSSEKAQTVFDLINKEELSMQRGAVGRFLLILAALYRVHNKQFSVVCDIRGRDRLYFANNEDALAESGSSTKPREIPNSPYWVITNSNTTRKKMMLTEVSLALGYDLNAAEKIRDLL